MFHKSRLLTPKEADDFRTSLQHYTPNGHVVMDFARRNFGVIAGPAGSGKDTIRTALLGLRKDYYSSVISTTTRPRRHGEKDGVEYHFRSVDFVEKGLAERRFLQAELVHEQQVSGLDFADVASLDEAQYGLSILVVQTEKKIRKLNPGMKTVFLIPPSYDELMRRLRLGRGMKDDELQRRLVAARQEIEIALGEAEYCKVLNDDLDLAVSLCDGFLRSGIVDADGQVRAIDAMHKILNTLSEIGEPA